MKKHILNIWGRGLLGVAVTSLLFALPAHSQDIYWIPSSAIWDTASINWSATPAGPATLAWDSSPTNDDIAVFQGTGEAVSLATSLSAGGLKFTVNGFSLSAGSLQTLNLTGAPVIDVATGATATLGANVRIMSDSKSFSKTGEGTLELTGSFSNPNFYLGGITASTLGAKINVNEGILKVSGNALNNTFTEVAVSAGAELQVNATLNLGGLSGAGAVAKSTSGLLTIQFRGINADFSGIISGNISLTKNNGIGWQQLSGSESNTFTGVTTVDVGELKLAKTGGAIAISSSQINLGATVTGNTAMLTLEGNDQVANTTSLVFVAGNNRNAVFNLNGHSETLGDLTINNLGTGFFTIDFGMNDTAQILAFNSLLTPGSGVLNIINFGVNDEFHFLNDPTAGLGSLTLNGGQAFAINQGSYWALSTIPEPGSVSLFLGGLFVLYLFSRKTRKRA